AFIRSAHDDALLLLAFLAENELARIFDAFALIRLRRPEPPDLRGHLPHLLLVDAGDDDFRRLRAGDLNALRNGIGDVVAIAELKLEILPLHRRAIADAGNLELLGETLGDAGDQIGHHGPRHAPHGARFLGILAHGDLDAAIFKL